MTDTQDIKIPTLFLNWQALFTTLNHFVSVPRLSIFNKRLMSSTLGITLGSLVSNCIQSDDSPKLLARLEKKIKREDLDRFVNYFKSPEINQVNETLLDIIICPDNECTLPFALLEIVFEVLSDVINLKDWSIIDYDKESIDYGQIMSNINRQNSIYGSKRIIDENSFNEMMMFMFVEELVRSDIEKSNLALLMPYLYRPQYNKLINIEKTEDSSKIKIVLNGKDDNKITCHWIEQIYPVDEPSIKEYIIRPHVSDLALNTGNQSYMKHFSSPDYKTFELKLGYKIGNILALRNSFIVMALECSDIEVEIVNDNEVIILIKKHF